MAINFEAANMAGYNYPHLIGIPIEITSDRKTVTSAPPFEEIVNILSHPAIPFIVGHVGGGPDLVIFHLTAITNFDPKDPDSGDLIGFTGPAQGELFFMRGQDLPSIV